MIPRFVTSRTAICTQNRCYMVVLSLWLISLERTEKCPKERKKAGLFLLDRSLLLERSVSGWSGLTVAALHPHFSVEEATTNDNDGRPSWLHSRAERRQGRGLKSSSSLIAVRVQKGAPNLEVHLRRASAASVLLAQVAHIISASTLFKSRTAALKISWTPTQNIIMEIPFLTAICNQDGRP